MLIADVVNENASKGSAVYAFAEPLEQTKASANVTKSTRSIQQLSEEEIKDISDVDPKSCRKIVDKNETPDNGYSAPVEDTPMNYSEVPAIYSEVKETTESDNKEAHNKKKETKQNILSPVRGSKENEYLPERSSLRGHRLTFDSDYGHVPLKTSSIKEDSDNDDNDTTEDDLNKNIKLTGTEESKNIQPVLTEKEHVYCDVKEEDGAKEIKKGRNHHLEPLELNIYQKQNLLDISAGSESSLQIYQTKDIDLEDLHSGNTANEERYSSSEDETYETVTPAARENILKDMTIYSDVLLKDNPEVEQKLVKTRTFPKMKSPSPVVQVQRSKSHPSKAVLPGAVPVLCDVEKSQKSPLAKVTFEEFKNEIDSESDENPEAGSDTTETVAVVDEIVDKNYNEVVKSIKKQNKKNVTKCSNKK